MCTVTIIPLDAGGFRLVTNRDELRRRAAALPPRIMPIGGGVRAERAVWPIDGEAGGTWIAATECGVVLTLLNVNSDVSRAATPAREHLLSRGGIIPAMLRAMSDDGLAVPESRGSTNPGREGEGAVRHSPLSLIAAAAARLDLARSAPFRLVGASERGMIELRWDRAGLSTWEHALAPMCFASSGLGDHCVEPRLGLWREWVSARGALPAAQDEFHEHRWPNRTDISVMMSRADARTVSTTWVAVGAARAPGEARSVVMRYCDDGGDRVVSLNGGPIGASLAVHERARC